MIGTMVFWVAGCIVHYFFNTAGILHGPQEGDLYVYSWGFQMLSFGIFPFPIWLLILGVVLLCEKEYFTRKKKKNHP